MAIIKSWDETRAEGRAEGRAQSSAAAVLTVLRVRGIDVSSAVRERVLAEQDLEQLNRWLEKAAVASSIDDVIDAAS